MAKRQTTIHDYRPQEIWKDVPGFENLYQVSNEGRLRRLNAIKCFTNEKGYPVTTLSNKSDKSWSGALHTIVARAFLGPRPEGLQVNHKDGDKTNAHLSNLEYVTRQQNMKHAAMMGFMRRGAQVRAKLYADWWPQRRLSREQVQKIRERLTAGESNSSIGRSLGIHHGVISQIKLGKSYK